MQLNMLGTGGYHPNEVRHTPCYLLPEQGIAFDAGTAAFRLPGAMTRKDLHLFLTHPHWDHIIGLTYLLVPMMLGQIEHVTIYANHFTLTAIKDHLFAEATFSHMPAFTFEALEDHAGGVRIADCAIQWMPLVSHTGGSVAYRLEHDGISLAYVTDTFVDGSYHDFIHGVQTLLHECYFDDDMQHWAEKTGHSYLSQVVQLATEVKSGQLLLTHMDPRINQQEPFDLTAARRRFSPIGFAHDQQILSLAAG